jgi:hypothetical protein
MKFRKAIILFTTVFAFMLFMASDSYAQATKQELKEKCAKAGGTWYEDSGGYSCYNEQEFGVICTSNGKCICTDGGNNKCTTYGFNDRKRQRVVINQTAILNKLKSRLKNTNNLVKVKNLLTASLDAIKSGKVKLAAQRISDLKQFVTYTEGDTDPVACGDYCHEKYEGNWLAYTVCWYQCIAMGIPGGNSVIENL